MKKIILSATLLGSFYFANAQVGIGTPTPVSSTMLDITAADKGVLIPRVNLTALNVFAPVTGTQENGLLVFATGEKNDKSASDVKSGFYYWNVNKWERIVNQTQLDQVISNQGDIAKIKALLNAAYGSNNLDATPSNDAHGGMVYTPAVGIEGQPGYVAPKFEYVKFNPSAPAIGTEGQSGYVPAGPRYEKVDATAGLIDLIQGNETKTTIVTIKNVQYYLSESFNKSSELAAALTDDAKYLVLFPTSGAATTGFFKIDVVGGVVNNFQSVLNGTTTIVKTPQTGTGENTVPATYYTVEQYIKYLSQNSQLTGDTKIVIDAVTGKASLQKWDGTAWVPVDNSVFSTIVKSNETGTTITRSKDNGSYTAITSDPKGLDKIVYEYSTEGTDKNYLDVTEDIKWLIENNEDIKKIINKLTIELGTNVGYTVDGILANNNTGKDSAGDIVQGLGIPAKSFYYVNENGVKVEIPLNDIVYKGITQLTETQVNDVKTKLGDNFKTTTIVKTGDVWTDGKAVYKGIFDAFIKNGTANVVKTAADSDYSEISISGTVGQIISITVLDGTGNKLTSSVTDVVTATTGVKFRIGTGNMYNVIYPGTGTTAIKVLIEYSAGAVVTP